MPTSAEIYAENVRRAASVNAAMNAFNGPKVTASKTLSSSGHNQILIDDSVVPLHRVAAKKIDRDALHPRTKARVGEISVNGAHLLDYIVRKDEAAGGGRLVDVIVQQIASALDLPEKEAEEARRELERLGLITFYDNYSGDRGYRPKV